MSLKPSQAVRILVLLGLFLAVPLLGFEQRFGGSGNADQRGSAQQQAQQTPAPQAGSSQRSGGAGQRPGDPGRGDRGPWEWWKDDAIKKELRLTDSQVRQITRIYDERSRQMKPHSDEYQKEFAELQRLTAERTVDVPTFSLQVNRVEALRTELSKTRLVMLYSFYRVLTPEQYEKFRAIRERQNQGRRGGGQR